MFASHRSNVFCIFFARLKLNTVKQKSKILTQKKEEHTTHNRKKKEKRKTNENLIN